VFILPAVLVRIDVKCCKFGQIFSIHNVQEAKKNSVLPKKEKKRFILLPVGVNQKLKAT